VALGYLIGASLSGAGRLYRHERVRARQTCGRPESIPARVSRPDFLSPFAPALVTGLLVAGLGPESAVAGYYAFLRYGLHLDVNDEGAEPRQFSKCARRTRLRCLADFRSSPVLGGGIFSPRGADGGRRHGRQGRGGGFPKTIRAIRRRSPTNVGDNVGDLRRHGGPTCFETFAVTTVATNATRLNLFRRREHGGALMLFPPGDRGNVHHHLDHRPPFFVQARQTRPRSWAPCTRGVIATGVLSLIGLWAAHRLGDRAEQRDRPDERPCGGPDSRSSSAAWSVSR